MDASDLKLISVSLTDLLKSVSTLVDPFDGEVFDDWLPSFESTIAFLGVKKTVDSISLPLLISRLTGEAKKLAVSMIDKTYNDAVIELKMMYPRKNISDLYKALAVPQGTLEPLEAYIHRFQHGLRTYHAVSRSNLDPSIQLILFQSGLLPAIRQPVMMAAADTLAECIKLARRAESSLATSNLLSASSAPLSTIVATVPGSSMTSNSGHDHKRFNNNRNSSSTSRSQQAGSKNNRRNGHGNGNGNAHRGNANSSKSSNACFDYHLKKNCTFRNCKYSHAALCHAFTSQGTCRYGQKCKFAHLRRKQQQQQQLVSSVITTDQITRANNDATTTSSISSVSDLYCNTASANLCGVRMVEANSVLSNESSSGKPLSISQTQAGVYLLDCMIEGLDGSFKAFLDSGATCCLVSERLASEIGTVRANDVTINQLDGSHVKSRGTCTLSLIFDKNMKLDLTFYVVDRVPHADILLGVPFLKKTTCDFVNDKLVFKSFSTSKSQSSISSVSVVPNSTMVQTLRSSFPAVFSEDLSKAALVPDCVIKLREDAKVQSVPYRINPQKAKVIDKAIDEMLALNIIQSSKSEFSSPVVLVNKKETKEMRFCVDFRRINSFIIEDRFPLPSIQSILDMLQNSKVFSIVDLKSGYWQIPLSPESRKFTAFVSHRGLFEYTRIPFGLSTAPAVFQRTMQTVFNGLIGVFVFVYLDDIIIFSKDVKDHSKHLCEVFQRLNDFNLRVSIRKCKFYFSSLRVLGFIVDQTGINPDPSKIEAIANWKHPTTVKQLQSFLGFANYYRIFVKGFAQIAAPLYELTKRDKKNLVWNEQCDTAFNSLKKVLTSSSTMRYPDFDKTFLLICDASSIAVGSVLSQLSDEGMEYPVAYFSSKLNPYESKYSAGELEILSIVKSILHFRPYLEGSRFVVVTDHKNVLQLLKKSELPPRLCRWAMLLQSFDFEIRHRAGKLNQAADMLSRATSVSVVDISNERLKSAQLQDTNDRPMHLETRDGLLVRIYGNNQAVPYVPEDLRSEVLYAAHDLRGHFGWKRMLEYLKRISWWPTQRMDAKNYASSCHFCQLKKTFINPQRYDQLQHLDATFPFQLVSIDFTGPFPISTRGNRFLLVFIDHFSRFVRLVPCKDQTAQSACEALFQFVADFAIPERILSDRGAAFISNLFQLLCAKMGIKPSRTTSYHPSGNGMVERINRLINAAFIPSFSDWEHQMRLLQIAINTTTHSVTGLTPHHLLFGKAHHHEPFLNDNSIDARHYLKMKQVNRKPDPSRIPIQFHVGDLVLVRSFALSDTMKKTSTPWIGPFLVMKTKNKLCLLRSMIATSVVPTWFNIQRLKKYHPRSSLSALEPPPSSEIKISDNKLNSTRNEMNTKVTMDPVTTTSNPIRNIEMEPNIQENKSLEIDEKKIEANAHQVLSRRRNKNVWLYQIRTPDNRILSLSTRELNKIDPNLAKDYDLRYPRPTYSQHGSRNT